MCSPPITFVYRMLITHDRASTKVSVLGVAERWKKQEKESWMSLATIMMMMTMRDSV